MRRRDIEVQERVLILTSVELERAGLLFSENAGGGN